MLIMCGIAFFFFHKIKAKDDDEKSPPDNEVEVNSTPYSPLSDEKRRGAGRGGGGVGSGEKGSAFNV